MKINKSLKDYMELLKQLSKQDTSGQILPPQLIVCCKIASMAKTLIEGISPNADELLDDEKEIFEFSDGQGAVRFPLKTGNSIVQLINLIGQGNYVTEPPKIISGMAIRLPISDRQKLRIAVNSEHIMGIGRLLDKEDFWWW
jgi:hypothetical protein